MESRQILGYRVGYYRNFSILCKQKNKKEPLNRADLHSKACQTNKYLEIPEKGRINSANGLLQNCPLQSAWSSLKKQIIH